MTAALVALVLCDAWRVWIVASFVTLLLAAPATASCLLPYWLALCVIVAAYDTFNVRRRRG